MMIESILNSTNPKRFSREITPEEQERLQRHRTQIAKELPDLAQRDRMRKEAQDEPTLSGELRRAIHAGEESIAAIASRSGITPIQLNEFLTGERTLRSDVLDRLATVLGFRFQASS